MVSGRNLAPAAPLLWTNRRPAASVMSTNRTAGKLSAGTGTGRTGATAAAIVGGADLEPQPARPVAARIRRLATRRLIPRRPDPGDRWRTPQRCPGRLGDAENG